MPSYGDRNLSEIRPLNRRTESQRRRRQLRAWLRGLMFLRLPARGVRVIQRGLVAALLFSAFTAGQVSAQTGYESAIYDACARHGCDGAHLVNTMYCESEGDPYAIGPNGEIGLLQFHPDTFYRIFGGSDIWNPWEQIDIAAFAFANGYADHWVCSGLYDGSPS